MPDNAASCDLDLLGLKHGTDKSSKHHDFLRFYSRFFDPIRAGTQSTLEVGVHDGGSIKMWDEYFTSGRIVGVDVNPKASRFASDRITIETADQSNIGDRSFVVRDKVSEADVEAISAIAKNAKAWASDATMDGVRIGKLIAAVRDGMHRP
jgi:hypothetical protein